MDAEIVATLRALITSDLASPDSEARAEFFRHFGALAEEFSASMAEALEKWRGFNDKLDETDERRRAVSAVAFTAMNLNASSFKLFMSGHTVAAGSLFRQVLEAIALALLCSTKKLTVLDRFLEDKYSTKEGLNK